MERKWIAGGIAGGGLLFFVGLVISLYGITFPLQPDDWWLSPTAEAEAKEVGEAVGKVAAEAVARERRSNLPAIEIGQPEIEKIVKAVTEEAAWVTAANPDIAAVAEAAVGEAVAVSAAEAEKVAEAAEITEAEKAMQAAAAATNPETAAAAGEAAEAAAIAVAWRQAPLPGMFSRFLIAGDGFPVRGFPVFGILIWIIVGGIGFYGGRRGIALYNASRYPITG